MKANILETIISQLETDNLVQFEEAILKLSKYIDTHFSSDINPLASHFGIENGEEKVAEIEVLDTAIQKHIKNISDKTLITFFGMTFKTSFDNFKATLIVIEEVISRKNTATQTQIIKKFYRGLEEYETGHRFLTYTVHDQLIDDLFAQFTSEALYILLKNAPTEMLQEDEMEYLFIPALQNTTDEKLQQNILTVFLKYEEEAQTYLEANYFDKLLQKIEDVISDKLKKIIATRKSEKKQEKEILSLLEDLKEEDLSRIIEILENEMSKKLEKKYFDPIIQASKKIKRSEANTEKLLDYIIKKNQKTYLSDFMFSQYDTKSPQKIIDFLTIQLEKKYLKTEEVSNIIENAIISLMGPNEHLEELKIYEDFMVNNCSMDYDQVYSIEVKTLLDLFFTPGAIRSNKDFALVIENIKTIVKKVVNEIEYENLESHIVSFLNSQKFRQLKQVFEAVYPKVKQTKEDLVLSYNIVASLMLKDESYFDLILKEVQKSKEVGRAILAYNLACAFATFDKKNQMLFYIKESIRLGKMKQQFLDDTDFEKYWTDTEFLVAIEDE